MTENNTTTMQVAVHKAAIKLGANESIGDYAHTIGKACREHVLGKLGIAQGKGGGWMVELYADKCVFCAYKHDGPNMYYGMGYKRNKTGTVEFGAMTEVVRQTVYKPAKPTVIINKSLGTMEGWEVVPTSKSIWDNVL